MSKHTAIINREKETDLRCPECGGKVLMNVVLLTDRDSTTPDVRVQFQCYTQSCPMVYIYDVKKITSGIT